MTDRVLFVGQGPNQTCWVESLARARHFAPDAPEQYAIALCARLAITGSVGEKIAALLGMHRLEFYRDAIRLNLNARWNGKAGRGDRFDTEEGTRVARGILRESPVRVVCLGAAVSACFGLDWTPLGCPCVGATRFCMLPHPSGLNPWWNDPLNRAGAARTLRDFCSGGFRATTGLPGRPGPTPPPGHPGPTNPSDDDRHPAHHPTATGQG
jgi:hypothetical protein